MFKFKKPIIGVTGPDKGGTAAWLFTAASVLLAGGIPKRITPSKAGKAEKLDGLIIGGGADVDPDTYEKENFMQEYFKRTIQNRRRSIFYRLISFIRFISYPILFFTRRFLSIKEHKIDTARDELEFKILHDAIEQNIPVLGICRGAQLINVYFKGSLHKEIGPFYLEEPNRASIFPVKRIQINAHSKLYNILSVKTLMVNALHHQAVKETGKGIAVTATEPNGIVQAIEYRDKFILGVQWHPEYLIGNKVQRKIFRALVEESWKKSTIYHLTPD